jgi:hypothetical protein
MAGRPEKGIDLSRSRRQRRPSASRTQKAEKQTHRGQPPRRPTSCAYCGAPLPPPAVTGRPRSFCSAQCRQANERVMVSRRFEEKQRRDREQREAEWEEREAERLRRAERDYQRAIAAGGDLAAEAKWQRLYDETLDATGSRWGLCQWELANDQPGACTRRTGDVYCAKHSRQVEREAEKRRRERDAERAAGGAMRRP